MFERQRSAKALVAGAFSLGLLVAACGGTSPSPAGTSAPPAGTSARRWDERAESASATAAPTEAGSAEAVTLTFLVNSGETNEAQAKALVDAFTAANPSITIQTSLRPGGTDGDNLVKTKLATGDMEDLFWYNSGSLLQALTPSRRWSTWPTRSGSARSTRTSRRSRHGTGSTARRGIRRWVAACCTTRRSIGERPERPDDVGGVQRQQREDQGRRKAAPILQRPRRTWTSQLFVLADFCNVQAPKPDFATTTPTNKAQYSVPRRPSTASISRRQDVRAGSRRTSRQPATTTPSRRSRPARWPSTRC